MYFQSWRFKLPGSVPSNSWKYIKPKSLSFPKAIITATSATAHYHFCSTCQTFSPNDPWLDGHIIDESCIVFRQIRVVLDRKTYAGQPFTVLCLRFCLQRLKVATILHCSNRFLPTRGCNSHVREGCKLVKRSHRKHLYCM